MPKQDVLTLLKADHAKVRDLLTQFAATTDRGIKTRQTLLAELESEIEVHARVEEEIFYPAYQEAAETKEERKLFFEAAEEHALVRHMLALLKDTAPDDEEFGARAKVLKDLVEHHAEEEEDEMFPKARRLLGAEALQQLAERVTARKEELEPKFARGAQAR